MYQGATAHSYASKQAGHWQTPTEYAGLQRQKRKVFPVTAQAGNLLGELESRAAGLLNNPTTKGLCEQQGSGEQWHVAGRKIVSYLSVLCLLLPDPNPLLL